MTLRVGTIVQDRYRVVQLLGGGGMGEVYRAVDQKLDRSVALKRLPPAIADDERRMRFEREAQAISQLTHPNICALYDVLEVEGQTYLVMQYIEGENLEERLQRGEPLTSAEVVELGIGIARGLAQAHSQGLIHRDLKPANIMLTPSGPVLLDFGVAKPMRGPDSVTRGVGSGSDLLADAATLTSAGMVLGTVQYMSPEQLQGKELDGRTDLFSFGAVLYEATCGHKAFEGDTQADWIAAILRSQPLPVREHMDSIPPALAVIIEKLLEKDREQRMSSAEELVEALRPLAALTASSPLLTSAVPTTRSRRLLFVAVAALASTLLLVAALAVWWSLREAASGDQASELRRIPMSLPSWAPLPLPGAFDNTLALSPSGDLLVWVAEIDGSRHLVRRRADSVSAERIEGTRNARQPFFSPDGEWIAFFTLPGGRLLRVRAEPGTNEPPIDIAPATLPLGGAWGEDDNIVFWSEFGQGLLEVPASGGTPREVVPLDTKSGEIGHAHVQIVGDAGEILLYSSVFGQDTSLAKVMAFDRTSGDRRVLASGGIRPRYLPNGVLVYAQKGQLSVVPFDLASLTMTESPEPLREADLAVPGSVPVQYAFARDGSFVYVPASGESGRGRTLSRVGLDGSVEATSLPERPYLVARSSPVDDRILIGLEDLLDIWVWDGNSDLRAVTSDPRLDLSAIWSPDGQSIVFSSNRATDGSDAQHVGLNLFRLDLATGEPAVPLTQGNEILFAEDWSADGRYLVVNSTGSETGSDLRVLDLQSGELSNLVKTPAQEGNADLSPDGQWMVFASEETGAPEVYVQAFSPGETRSRVRFQVSVSGGNQPVFAPDGRRIYFRQRDSMFFVDFDPANDPPTSEPQLLFERKFYRHGSEGRSFDVTEDGFWMFFEAPRRGAELILVQGLMSRMLHGERDGGSGDRREADGDPAGP